MSYLVINGSDIHYNVRIVPFTTQHGYSAIRFIGESVPETDKGFKYYSDDDILISDYSDFTHLYRDNQYSVEEDIIEYPAPNNTPSAPSSLERRLSAMSQQINAITPYTDSKSAYIDDTECVFNNITKQGTLTVNVIDRNGAEVPFEVLREDNNIIVSFEPLEEVATVSIVIQ